MGWPYQFLDLSSAEKHARRVAIDRYAGFAQLSALLPAVLFLLYRIAVWAVKSATAARGGSYNAVPNSPSLKVQRQTKRGAWSAQLRRLRWWLGGDVYVFGQLCGQRDQWLFASLWTVWLLAMSVLGTGQGHVHPQTITAPPPRTARPLGGAASIRPGGYKVKIVSVQVINSISDYLHLTKRFGSIALSQFPVLYLMSLKSLNPFVYIFRSSHEQVNRLHRALGRVLYILLALHLAFYLNYFAAVGILGKRLFAPVVFAGVMAFVALSLLSGTALRVVRNFSYRVFFITHLLAATAMAPLLFFHAHPARLFVVEAVVVFIADLISRKLDTTVSEASLEPIPGTTLVKLSAPIPQSKLNRFRAHPSSHVYLSVPSATRPSSNPVSPSFLIFEFLFNPFTIASVDENTSTITLVARRMGGPMTAALGKFAARQPPTDTDASGSPITPQEKAKVPLCIEGPYGIARHFPSLTDGRFSRILLVAGGVGATFTVPLYQSIVRESPSSTKAEMVWAVRTAAEATWAVSRRAETEAGAAEKSILDDQNVHVFLTGDELDPDEGDGVPASPTEMEADGDVEMSLMHRGRRHERYASRHSRRRPDLKKIVDDFFGRGSEERVAVVVCGPAGMAKELREHVGVWVRKGRPIWWHNEGFGF